MNEREYIKMLFNAEIDYDYYKRRGSWGKVNGNAKIVMREQNIEIYIRGDEHIEEDGTYIKIFAEEGTVYIAREMIERLSNEIKGDVVELY